MTDKYEELREESKHLRHQKDENLRKELKKAFTEEIEYDAEELEEGLRSHIRNGQDLSQLEDPDTIYQTIVDIRFFRNNLKKQSDTDIDDQLLQDSIITEDKLWDEFYKRSKTGLY
jgi:hypothetical protein